jgi:predicted secreted protein
MRHRLAHYAPLLLVIIFIVPLVACTGLLETGLKPAPDVQWYQTFGGLHDDLASSVQQTPDGGYILCGYTKSYGAGGVDVWLIKTDADGNKLWDKTFGGKKDDGGLSAQRTVDGGYILCGNTFSYGAGGKDVWLIKTDDKGNKLWDKAFGGKGNEEGYSVQQTTDGGYVICGDTTSYGVGGLELWLLKTDKDGKKLWDNTFAGELAAIGNSVQQTADGGYIICGLTGSSEAEVTVVWLIKTDEEGNELWDEAFLSKKFALGNSVQQTADGCYIVCGAMTASEAGGGGIWLIKADANGTKIWDRVFGSGYGRSVQQTRDGGYIVCGSKKPSGASYSDVWLIKTDKYGIKLWDKTFGNVADEFGISAQQTTDGGYIVCGTTKSYGSGGDDVLLLKIAPE